jgi:outer membrane protein TolC
MPNKKTRHLSNLKCVVLLASAMVLWQSNTVFAKESIWYQSDDPLKTKAFTPPPIPEGYLERSVCDTITDEKILSLADVAEAALCNNPQTHEAYASARVQAAQVGIAQSAYLPTVIDNVASNLNITLPQQTTRSNPYSNLSNNIVASYLLYDFGNRDAALENARQLLQAASATQSNVVQIVLLSAIQAYYQVQASTAGLEAALEAEHASEESFKAAQARYKAGVSTPADKLQAQTLFAQNTLNRISIEGNLKNAYGTLANVMGLAANQNIKILPSAAVETGNNIEQNIQALIEQASSRRPDLMASEAQLKAAQASIEISKAASKPIVSIGVSNGFQSGNSLASSDNSSLGVTVTIPIFSGYAPTYRIRAAEANFDVRAAQRDKLRLQISLDVWRAYQNLHTANESINAAVILVSSAEESSRVAMGRYKAGVGNILDSINAQSALASAHQQQIQATLNWNIARATLAQAIGSLDNAMIQLLPAAKNQ